MKKNKNKHNKSMKKTTLFYIMIFVFVTAVFSSLLPYPIFSNYTNVSENEIFDINNYQETELTQIYNHSPQVLDLDFKQINALLPIESKFEIFDITGENSFIAQRTGGQNHLDIEPTSEEDFQNLLKITNFTLDWTRTAVYIKLSDTAYVPASLCAYPHGYKTLGTSCTGHFCLHFKNSKTDGSGKVDTNHQKAIDKANKNSRNFINKL